METFRFKFKMQNDETTYAFQGSEDALRAAYGNVIIISKKAPLEWDEDLKKYV